jgi:Tfp pilus assembly protein PilN
MLRTNLSTRPFYNERRIHGVLAVLVAIVVGVAIFNATRIVVLSQRQSALGREADAAETRARDLRARAAQLRQSVNTKQLDAMSGAAREANAIIGQRLFSWTELLNRLESTLPDNVRITSLRPRVERDGTITVIMTVTGTSTEQIEMFMANLDGTTAFTDVFASEDRRTEDGQVQATVEGKYAGAP